MITFGQVETNQINIQKVYLIYFEESRDLITSNELYTFAGIILS